MLTATARLMAAAASAVDHSNVNVEAAPPAEPAAAAFWLCTAVLQVLLLASRAAGRQLCLEADCVYGPLSVFGYADSR